jgi:hypothetical protein
MGKCPFIKQHATKGHLGVEVWLHAFLIRQTLEVSSQPHSLAAASTVCAAGLAA